MMAHIDLCSGIGGFSYAFETVGLSKPVLFCEIDPWCRKVLKKHWPDVPQCEDVKELADDPDRYVPRNLDWSNTIVSGGYPCQAFSVAGKQKGWEDPRAIWPWLHKLVALKRPKFCVFENVTGHIALGLDKVLNDLEGENYSIATLIIPASAVGAPHKRERLWIVAHANSKSEPDVTKHEQERFLADTKGKRFLSASKSQLSKQEQSRLFNNKTENESEVWSIASRRSELRTQNVADTQSARARQNDSGLRQGSKGIDRGQGTDKPKQCDTAQQQEREQTAKPWIRRIPDGLSKGLDRFGRHDGFEVEPDDIPRVASGIKDRANRLKGLGNAIVPGIAMQIGLAIKETQWK